MTYTTVYCNTYSYYNTRYIVSRSQSHIIWIDRYDFSIRVYIDCMSVSKYLGPRNENILCVK